MEAEKAFLTFIEAFEMYAAPEIAKVKEPVDSFFVVYDARLMERRD